MNNTNLHLFVINGLLDHRDTSKVERLFQDILDWEDMKYLACCHEIKNGQEIFICCFAKEKITLLDKELSKLEVIIKSEDISEIALKSKYCEELELVIKDHPDNKIIIENFILDNIDLDIILDKICYHGMESLSQVEKKYLETL